MYNKLPNNLDILLLDTPESYYWIGFILADGYMSENNVLSFTLSEADRNHLEKFATYIGYKHIKSLQKKLVRLSVCDKNHCIKIKNKFDIGNRKTYSPPNLNWIDDKNLFISLLAGYIDGDGSMEARSGSCSIRFHVHSSWMPFILWVRSQILKFYGVELKKPTINKGGHLRWDILTFPLIKQMKRDLLKLKIPLLPRKWSKINENFVSEKEQTIKNMEIIRKNMDKSYKFIMDNYNIPYYTIGAMKAKIRKQAVT